MIDQHEPTEPDPAVLAKLRETRDLFQQPEHFIPSSLMIRDPFGDLVDLNPRRAQIRLLEAVAERRRQGKLLRFLVIKSRRHGISAIIAALILHQLLLHDGQKGLVLAHLKDAAKNIFGFYKDYYENYKPFNGIVGIPRRTSDADSQTLLAFENASSLSVGTARVTDIGRSFGYRFVHLSEYAHYLDIQALLTGLTAAIADDLDAMAFKETTALGYNLAYQEWEDALAGKTEWCPLFFGRYDDERNVLPLLSSFDANPDVEFDEQYDKKVQEFTRSLRDQEWEIIKRFKALGQQIALEQINWERHKRAEFRDNERGFLQEYPASWEEAFQASGRQRFDPKLFLWMRLTEGDKGRLVRKEINRRERIVFVPGDTAELTVWEGMQDFTDYVGGCDPSKGVDINDGVGSPDPDYSAACVVRRVKHAASIQVAELHERIQPFPLAQWLYDIGEFYNWVFWVIEVEFSGGNGAAVCAKLLELGYPSDRIYYHHKIQSGTPKPTRHIGYEIRPESRQTLIAEHEQILLTHNVEFRSKPLVMQHKTFVTKARGRVEHEDGTHDDRVFGAMYASQGLLYAPARKFEVDARTGRRDFAPPDWERKTIDKQAELLRDRLRRM